MSRTRGVTGLEESLEKLGLGLNSYANLSNNTMVSFRENLQIHHPGLHSHFLFLSHFLFQT